MKRAPFKKHGMHGTRLHRIWNVMRARCYWPKSDSFARYGGRGIQICEEWRGTFIQFMQWALANGYRDDLCIDRINNDGNYEPTNCRWVTPRENAARRPSNSFYLFNGERLTVAEIERRCGLKRDRLLQRLVNAGVPHEVEIPAIFLATTHCRKLPKYIELQTA